jgi:hypothetical protein
MPHVRGRTEGLELNPRIPFSMPPSQKRSIGAGPLSASAFGGQEVGIDSVDRDHRPGVASGRGSGEAAVVLGDGLFGRLRLLLCGDHLGHGCTAVLR